MKERIIIVFVAVIIGLVLTTVGYLLYQSFNSPVAPKSPAKPITDILSSSSPTPDPNNLYVTLIDPKNESITDKRTITVKGKTNPGNTVVLSSNQEDIVATPADNGTFSTSITINAGANILIARAVSPNGEEVQEEYSVTFVSEDF